MSIGNHERLNLPPAVKIGVEKLVNTTVAGNQAQASVRGLPTAAA